MKVWHYTNGLVIGDIIRTGVIKLATAGIAPPEKPGAHFSTNPHWDASANRGNMTLKHKGDYQAGVQFNINPTKDVEYTEFDAAAMDRDWGRFRIDVVPEAAPHGWRTYCKLANVPHAIRDVMDKGELGNPNEWRHSLQPVPRKFWRTVEKMEHGVWVTWVDIHGGVAGESPEGGRWGRS